MKKKLSFFSILFLIMISIYSGYAIAQTVEEIHTENIRQSLNSGIYTSGNLDVNIDRTGIPSNVKVEVGKEIGNLIEFETGNMYYDESNVFNRIAFLTFEADINIGTTYGINDVCYQYETYNSQDYDESIRYMKVMTYEEDFFGTNENYNKYSYYIHYNNIFAKVSSDLGIDKNIYCNIDFNTDDFVASDTVLDDGSVIRNLDMISSIDSVSVKDVEYAYLDSANNIYQITNLNILPQNMVSDLHEDDYKTEEDAPYGFRAASIKIQDAGLTGVETTQYLTTSGQTGHQAKFYCQQGDISGIDNKYKIDVQLEPQVQLLQQTLWYNKIISGYYDYITLEDAKEESTEFATAQLSKGNTFDRIIGIEVYNVNIHFTMRIVVKLIISTEYTKTVQGIDVSDSEIEDTIKYQEGDMYWDATLSQEVGSYLFDTSTWWDRFTESLGLDGLNLGNILMWGIIIIALIFIVPIILPLLTPLITGLFSSRNRRR